MGFLNSYSVLGGSGSGIQNTIFTHVLSIAAPLMSVGEGGLKKLIQTVCSSMIHQGNYRTELIEAVLHAFCTFVGNSGIMVTIEVKDDSKQAKKFLEYIKTLPFVKFKESSAKTKDYPISKNVPNAETLRSMERTSKGIGLTKARNLDEFLKEIGEW